MKRERLSETSPAFRILSMEPRYGLCQGCPQAGEALVCAESTDAPPQPCAHSSRIQNLPTFFLLPFCPHPGLAASLPTYPRAVVSVPVPWPPRLPLPHAQQPR